MVVDSPAEVHGVLTHDSGNAIFSFMRIGVLALVFGIGVLAIPNEANSRQNAPWVGTWQLNFSKSSTPAESARYKRVTTTIDTWQDGLKVTYDMVGIRGGVTHLEWVGRFDGSDYPLQGLDYVMTNAYRLIDHQSYEIVVKVDGDVTSTSRVVVSPDAKTLTVRTEGRTATGQRAGTVSVYDRQ